MNSDPDLACPTCGNVMELLTAEGRTTPPNYMRICPVCAMLAWNREDGTIETRAPQKVEGQEYEELTRNMKFVSIEEERRRIREIVRREREEHGERS